MIAGQLAEPGSMQAIAGRFGSPVLRQLKVQMSCQAGQRGAALLATAASIGIAVQGLQEQLCTDRTGFLSSQCSQPTQIGVVGTCPGGSTA